MDVPLRRSKSHDIVGSEPPSPRWRVKRRTKSVDFRLCRRFDATVSIERPAPGAPRQVQVTVVWNYQNISFTLQLRKLIFWAVLLLLLIPAHGLKVSPFSRFLVSHTNIRTLATDFTEKDSAAVYEPLFDELNHAVIPSVSDSSFASELARFAVSRDLSMTSLSSAAGRICVSAVLHKMVGAVLDSDVANEFTSCMMHAASIVS